MLQILPEKDVGNSCLFSARKEAAKVVFSVKGRAILKLSRGKEVSGESASGNFLSTSLVDRLLGSVAAAMEALLSDSATMASVVDVELTSWLSCEDCCWLLKRLKN